MVKQAPTQDSGPTIWMVGYQGRSWDSIAAALRSYRIGCVVDVRARPFSRRPGFGAPQLARALSGLGVGYLSLPELGCTPDHRRALRRHEPLNVHGDAYRDRLATQGDAVQRLTDLARLRCVLVLCMERRPQECHRAVLAERLAAEGFRVAELLEP